MPGTVWVHTVCGTSLELVQLVENILRRILADMYRRMPHGAGAALAIPGDMVYSLERYSAGLR